MNIDISVYNTLIPTNLIKYKNSLFIETGSNKGLGIKVALECGFDKVISCDINKQCYEQCLLTYSSNNKVELHLSDSINFLKNVSTRYKNNITFWLDAHDDSPDACPIVRELDVIKNYYENTNTILIDDINLLGKAWAKSLTLDTLKNALYDINSNYKIEIMDRKCKYGGQLLAAFL